MEAQGTLGGLMPLLILGAPLVASVFDLLNPQAWSQHKP